MKNLVHALVIAAVAVMSIGEVAVAKKKAPAPPELTESGQKLATEYTSMLEALKADIKKSIPDVNEKKMAAFTKAAAAEKAAEAALAEAQKAFGAINSGRALVAHAKGKWIGGAERGIAATKEQIKNAKTDEERKAAEEQLAKWEKNKQDGLDALKERQAKLDAALADEPRLTKELESAKTGLEKAQQNTLNMLAKLGLERVLKSDKLDAKLAKHYILSHGTPQALAAFAQQGKSQEKLIQQLLADDDLMLQMASADGAKGGNYGPAMELYTAIQKASKKAGSGVLQNLAVGTAVEIAGREDAVDRYLDFEKAYLAGELDPAFKDMTAWDYRNVVNGDESAKSLAWGREMLKNYRPDHITTPDYRWRYVGAVRSDIKYGSSENKYDKPELERYQNILMNGGVCGRRAFFGRFILRSFGIPTVPRPQRGHAALAHWTPDGWVVCLGGGWGIGWVSPPNGGGRVSDLDFLAVSQGRSTGEPYKQVLRAQWIGNVLGEPGVWGLKSGVSGTWNTVSMYQQRAIIAEAKAVTLAAVGEDIGEANETKEKIDIVKVQISEEDKKIRVGKKGEIIIPAAATTEPKESSGKIIFMDSVLGGKQLHYSRNGADQDFIYTFDAPTSGKYAMSMKVVTPSWKQKLTVAANDDKPAEMELPHTVGMWEDTKPVKIALAKGKNSLTFSRNNVEQEVAIKGFTLKEITLTPVK